MEEFIIVILSILFLYDFDEYYGLILYIGNAIFSSGNPGSIKIASSKILIYFFMGIHCTCIEPTYQTLTHYFEKVTDWKKLGACLLDDDDGTIIHKIEKSNRYDEGDCLCAMIREYLKSGNASWETVLSSLRSAKYINLATTIENDLRIYLPTQG